MQTNINSDDELVLMRYMAYCGRKLILVYIYKQQHISGVVPVVSQLNGCE